MCKAIPRAIQWLTDDIDKLNTDFDYKLMDEAEQVLKDAGKKLRDAYHAISDVDEKFYEYLEESVIRKSFSNLTESDFFDDMEDDETELYALIRDNLIGEFWTRENEFVDDCTSLGIDVDEMNAEYACLSMGDGDFTDYVKVWFVNTGRTFAIESVEEQGSY